MDKKERESVEAYLDRIDDSRWIRQNSLTYKYMAI